MSKMKYPRTPHLPYSLGATNDDKKLQNDSNFNGMKVIVTEKMDGENTSLYYNGFHARSLDSKVREYHSWLAAYHAKLKHLIPENMRLCGEYMYAQHSIHYKNLQSYFLLFSTWVEDMCESWAATTNFVMYAKSNKIPLYTTPVLYTGIYDAKDIEKIYKAVVNQGGEGIVVRNYDAFKYDSFGMNVAKAVRPNHVQTDKHWSNSEIIKNELGWEK